MNDEYPVVIVPVINLTASQAVTLHLLGTWANEAMRDEGVRNDIAQALSISRDVVTQFLQTNGYIWAASMCDTLLAHRKTEKDM